MAIPNFESVGDAVAATNAKMLVDGACNAVLQGAQNLNAHMSRQNLLSESVMGGWAERLITPDPSEAISTQKLLTGRDSMPIAEAIALAQIIIKGAQTTPPPTHGL